MAPEINRLVRQVTFVLLAIAAAATELASGDGTSLLSSLAMVSVWLGISIGIGWFAPTPADAREFPSRRVLLILLILGAIPFAIEPLCRIWTGSGNALEVVMIFALRNLGFGLAAFSSWLICLRLASAISLFLILFAVSIADHPAVVVLLGLYSATGSIWLMLVYWMGLKRFLVASETTVSIELQPDKARLPWLAVLAAVGMVSCTLGVVAAGPHRTVGILVEWLPTSGGTGEYDPYARGGVNDGDEETKGDYPNSTGMTQTDTFLDSPLPSLYDTFNDLYGEPFKPKAQERAIALDASAKVIESKKTPADNRRPNREFPIIRKSPAQPRDVSDRSARAIFEVHGRTPLHVRVIAYDRFDGLSWREAPMHCNAVRLEKEQKSNWMRLIERIPPPVYGELEQHRFKLTAPEGSFLPTPPHLMRFRVGRVNQTDFFGWGHDRILRMSQRKTPSGITIETESRTADSSLLDAVDFHYGFGRDHSALPANLNAEIVSLAYQWIEDKARGWPQIAVIVSRLRSDYAHDPTARVPENCEDSLGHFLLRSKRGTDYQFASSAAVLLRVLGYPTRLVSGFYVSPDHYDAESRHTPVVREDLHFWAEVMLPSGDWMVIEPTPGYEVLAPAPPIGQRILAGLMAIVEWSLQRAIGLTLTFVGLIALWWRRRSILDFAVVTFWLWLPGRTWQQRVRRTLWLLQWRAGWAGLTRHHSQTISDWLAVHLGDFISDDAELQQVLGMFEWAVYASELQPGWDEEQVRRICEVVLSRWTFQRWHSAVLCGVTS